LLLFWLGASRKNWILTIPAIIGQVSLVNTYAHIHTALIMSMQRSFNGLVLGIAVGLLLIIGVRMLFAIYRRLEQRGL
jgi:ABC-type nitrate/sulfonate/bicarbonate transport system permease component